MAAYNKFNQFTKDLIDGVHDFDAHTFRVMLTNVAPVATNTVRANITEIAAGNGYTAGGLTTAITTSTASGVAKITATDVTFTATGGSIATFRYVVIYNDTPTTPLKPLMCWIDYGSAVTLAAGESLLVDFDATNGLATVA
jgi:hypothetical protein